jgi:competence CoiA-like predicted nuclease
MVEIIVRGKGAKQITCRSCDSVLQYHKGEVKEYHGRDYSGGPDGKEWIDCPVCNEEVIIRAW